MSRGVQSSASNNISDRKANTVQDLPAELASVRGLQILDVGENKLYRIPECLASLENLMDLWLDQNGIKALPLPPCSILALKV